MSPATWLTDPERRNVVVLAVCQALFMSVQTMGIATTPLAAHSILGADKSLATLPLVLVHVGIMATTIPASLLMARIGRRAGFSVGALSGVASGVVSLAGIYQPDFVLLCLGAFLQGVAAAFAWYFRFAAADAASDAFRPRAISLVLAGGVVAGVLGPQTAKWAVDLLSPVVFAGVYMMVSVYSVAVLLAVQLIRIPGITAAERAEGGRPMREIVRQPGYIVALVSSMFGYGVMTLIMSATPLAMLACGYAFADSATVIQWHVIGMFLPAFFTGRLIQRYGVFPVVAVGAAIQLVCALVNLAGVDFMNFLIANLLVGLGWNLTYVGGSTLLTTTYRPVERAKVQASHDFLVYATTALAAGLSGVLHAEFGWMLVNIAAIPMMAIVIVANVWLRALRRREELRQVAAE